MSKLNRLEIAVQLWAGHFANPSVAQPERTDPAVFLAAAQALIDADRKREKP